MGAAIGGSQRRVQKTPRLAVSRHQGGEDSQYNEWGFSTAADMRDDKGDAAKVEKVPAIRISEWIKYHILERRIPSTPTHHQEGATPAAVRRRRRQQQRPPVVGMKIDIEGSEYVVLPDLIRTGTICNFDFVFGEFHSRFAE